MNTEMLLELVRERPCLYDMSMKKYSDHAHKESIWIDISSILKQPGMYKTLSNNIKYFFFNSILFY